MKHFFILVICQILLSTTGLAKETVSLNELLDRAYKNNPQLRSAKLQQKGESHLVTSQSSLQDPMIGLSTLDRNVETKYLTVTQKLRFPIKYYLQNRAQKSRADSKKAAAQLQELKVRKKVISTYYAIYSIQKIIHLTQINMEAVKEVARVAEKKYAAGKAPQGDSMKAHFELTQLELDLIRLQQQEEALQDQLRATLNDQSFPNLDLKNREFPVPIFLKHKLQTSVEKLTQTAQEQSPQLKTEMAKLKELEWKSTLSKWEFAPDIQFQYQQRIEGLPEDSRIYSVGLTFPLWFWKKSSEASASSAFKMAQEYKVKNTLLNLLAKINDLKGKVESGEKTLKIYKTSLIPQANGAYNSSRASYRANKASFLDLLDSERSLYRVRSSFYKSLQLYTDHLTQLETELGYTVSDFQQGVKK